MRNAKFIQCLRSEPLDEPSTLFTSFHVTCSAQGKPLEIGLHEGYNDLWTSVDFQGREVRRYLREARRWLCLKGYLSLTHSYKGGARSDGAKESVHID